MPLTSGNPFISAVSFLAYCILLGIFLWWAQRQQYRRSAALVRQWADLNGFTINELRYRWLRHGPFFAFWSWQDVFRVTVTDPKGRVRRGWIRTGGWLSDRPLVRWDDEVGPVHMSWSIPLTCVIGGLVLMIVGVFHGVLVPGNAGVSGAPSMQSASLLIVGGVCLAAVIVLGLWRWRAGAADDIDPREG